MVLRSGIVDSSGLRFYYTENVRQYDAGIFYTGTYSSPHLLIPPQQTNWKMKGYCPAVCTEKVTSEDTQSQQQTSNGKYCE